MSPGAARQQLEECLRAALMRVDAGASVARVLRGDGASLEIAGEPLAAGEALRVLAVGKAAFPMAKALVDVAGERVREALIVTAPGHAGSDPRLRVLEAGHPVPDARSERAADEAFAVAGRCGPEEALVVLLSGGASSLLAAPQAGLSLADLAHTTDLLLRAGADIVELNTVRRHLTRASGGRLAAACVARRLHLLLVSDVPGDDPAVVGSGPCTGDRVGYADARAVLAARGLEAKLPQSVLAHLRAGREPVLAPDDARLARVRTTVLARNADAVAAAGERGRSFGWSVRRALPLSGEARDAGTRLARIALGHRAAPVLWVAGGETTVTVTGSGRGGRSQELALAAAITLAGSRGVALLAAGSDGIDGPTDAAGAFADGGTVARGRAAGHDARAALRENDAYTFFDAEGGLLRTGPTGTNVMDLALVLRN